MIRQFNVVSVLGAKNVSITPTAPVTLICGNNGAGKSSIKEALIMALTGQPSRVSLKKNYAQLVTSGNAAGYVDVFVGEAKYSMTLPAGDGEHMPASAALMVALGVTTFEQLELNERRKLLFDIAGIQISPSSIKERLAEKGCEAAKIEAVLPFLRAGFSAAEKHAKEAATEAKGVWRAATGETYGEKKAAAWRADRPAYSEKIIDELLADIDGIDKQIASANQHFGALLAAIRLANSAGERRNALSARAKDHETLKKQLGEQLLIEENAKAAFAEAKGAAIETFTCPDCGSVLIMNAETSQLQSCGNVPAVPAEAAFEMLHSAEAALIKIQHEIAVTKQALSESDAAVEALAQLNSVAHQPTADELTAAQAKLDLLNAARNKTASAVGVQEDAKRLAQHADKATAKAATAHRDVTEWSKIAAALAPDGIQSEMIAAALAPVNARLAVFANTAGWMCPVIGDDMTISVHIEEKNLRNYSMLSESEQWRVDALIAAAISELANINILFLDRFDVLDNNERAALIEWLDYECIPAIVFGTLKEPPKLDGYDNTCAFWVDCGVCLPSAAQDRAA